MSFTEIGMLCLSFVTGLGTGAFFYLGLWWTILRYSTKSHMLWWWTSFILRLTVTLSTFYLVAGEHLARYVFILLGFIISRKIVLKIKLREQRN